MGWRWSATALSTDGRCAARREHRCHWHRCRRWTPIPAPLAAAWPRWRPVSRAVVALVAQLASEGGDEGSAETAVWAMATLRTIESHRRDLAPAPRTAASIPCRDRLDALAATVAPHGRRDAFRLSFRSRAQAALDRLPRPRGQSRSRAATTCWRPRRDWRASSRSRTATCPRALVPPRARRDPRRSRRSARLVVGIDVRVPDAVARHARARRQPARADQSPDRRRQQAYGGKLGVPWGISESAYNARDLELTYQYSSFGVPGLGLKRGLSENTVVAPYATALAAMVEPHAAVAQLCAAASASTRGASMASTRRWTTRRASPAGRRAVCHRARLHGAPPGHDDRRARQHAARRRDAQPLPRRAPHQGNRAAAAGTDAARRVGRPSRACRRAAPRIWTDDVIRAAPLDRTPHHATPRTRVLSNGRYAVMLTAAGSGYSRWRDLAVTRWREPTSPATPGARTFSCATWTTARSGPPGISRPASSPTPTRSPSASTGQSSSVAMAT